MFENKMLRPVLVIGPKIKQQTLEKRTQQQVSQLYFNIMLLWQLKEKNKQ